jgi:hypothetical protein
MSGIGRKSPISSIWFACVIGGLASFLLSLRVGLNSWSFPDAVHFIKQANAMNNGFQYMENNPDEMQFPFGLPTIIAIMFRIQGSDSLITTKLILICFHVAALICFTLIVRKLIENPKIQFLTILAFSFDPFILSQAIDLQTEPITTFFILWWCYVYLSEVKDTKRGCLTIVLFYLSGIFEVITRPNSLIPFIGIGILVFMKHRKSEMHLKFHLLGMGIFSGLLIFQAFLWTVFGGFLFLAANGGQNLVLACRNEFVPQYLGVASESQNQEINACYFQYLNDAISKIMFDQTMVSIPQLNKELFKIGFENCTNNLLETTGLLVLKVFGLWRPSTVFGAYGTTIFVLSILIWLPLSIATCVYLLRKTNNLHQQKFKYFVIMLWVLFTISLFPSATQIRHRIAFSEPFLWIIAGMLLSNFLQEKKLKK